MPEEQATTISFSLLPDSVKDWVSSLKCTYAVLEINKKNGIAEEKMNIIPRLIFRLITKDLKPENFIKEISIEFDLEPAKAKSVAEDVDIRILKPIEADLKILGVNTQSIYAYSAEAWIRPAPQPPKVEMKIPPPPPPPPKPTGPKVDLESFEIKGPSPFMLHQETVSYPTAQEIAKPKMAPHIELTPQQKSAAAPPRPVNVRLETPKSPAASGQAPATTTEQRNKETEEQKQLRVVHYSNLRTPLAEQRNGEIEEQKNRGTEEQRNRRTEGRENGGTEKQNQPMEKPALPALPTRKELEASREQENLNAGRTKIVNYAGPNTPLTAAGTPKPAETNTVDLRKIFKPEPKSDESTIDLRKKP